MPIASSAAELATHVRSEGVCLIESVLDRGALAELEGALNALEPRKLQNRRKHRWEHVHSPEAAPYVQLASQPEIAAAVRALLGPKTYLEKAGMLVSHPGAEAQRCALSSLLAAPPHRRANHHAPRMYHRLVVGRNELATSARRDFELVVRWSPLSYRVGSVCRFLLLAMARLAVQ